MAKKRQPVDPDLLSSRHRGDVVVLETPARRIGSQAAYEPLSPNTRLRVMGLAHLLSEDPKSPPTVAFVREWDDWAEAWGEPFSIHTDAVRVRVEVDAGIGTDERGRVTDTLDPMLRETNPFGRHSDDPF